eukprot:403363267
MLEQKKQRRQKQNLKKQTRQAFLREEQLKYNNSQLDNLQDQVETRDEKLEDLVIEELTNKLVQTIISQFCSKLSQKYEKQKIFMNKPIITKPSNLKANKEWLKQFESPQFSLKSSYPQKSLNGTSVASHQQRQNRASNQVTQKVLGPADNIKIVNNHQQNPQQDDIQSAISFTTNQSQFLNPFTLNSKLNPPYRKQISSSSQNKAQQKSKNPFIMAPNSNSNENSLSTNTGQAGNDLGYVSGSRKRIRIDEPTNFNSSRGGDNLLNQKVIMSNPRQQPEKKDSIMTIRKFKTQREQEKRDSSNMNGHVDIIVDDLNKFNKINSLNEEESQLSEDDDANGSLTESPDIKKQKINEQINSNLLRVNQNKHSKNFDSDLNSQNAASHNKLKGSISSIDEKVLGHRKNSKQSKVSHQKFSQTSKNGSIKQHQLSKPIQLSQSKQFRVVLVNESEDDQMKKSYMVSSNLHDDISVIMQTQNEDDLLSVENNKEQNRSFHNQRPKYSINQSLNHKQKFMRSNNDKKFNQIQSVNLRDSTQNLKEKRRSKLRQITASPPILKENQLTHKPIQQQKFQSETRRLQDQQVKHNSSIYQGQNVLTHRDIMNKRQQQSQDNAFFHSRPKTKKNEEVLRIYREANEQMFRQTGLNNFNQSYTDVTPTINLNNKLRKSNELFHAHRKTNYGSSFLDSSNNSTTTHSKNQYSGMRSKGIGNLITQRTQISQETNQTSQLPYVSKQESQSNNYSSELDKSREKIRLSDMQISRFPSYLRDSQQKLDSLMKIEETQLQNQAKINQNFQVNLSQQNENMFRRTRGSFKNAAKLIYKIDRNDMLDKILQNSSPQKHNQTQHQQQNYFDQRLQMK